MIALFLSLYVGKKSVDNNKVSLAHNIKWLSSFIFPWYGTIFNSSHCEIVSICFLLFPSFDFRISKRNKYGDSMSSIPLCFHSASYSLLFCKEKWRHRLARVPSYNNNNNNNKGSFNFFLVLSNQSTFNLTHLLSLTRLSLRIPYIVFIQLYHPTFHSFPSCPSY